MNAWSMDVPDGQLEPPAPAESMTCDVCDGKGTILDATDCDHECHAFDLAECEICRDNHACTICGGSGEV